MMSRSFLELLAPESCPTRAARKWGRIRLAAFLRESTPAQRVGDLCFNADTEIEFQRRAKINQAAGYLTACLHLDIVTVEEYLKLGDWLAQGAPRR